MKILVIGAGGFIGRHLCTALAAAGHQARRAELRPVTTWDRPEAWLPLLQGMDGVVYAAGCLRDQAGGVDDLLDPCYTTARQPLWPTPARRRAWAASCMCLRCVAASAPMRAASTLARSHWPGVPAS